MSKDAIAPRAERVPVNREFAAIESHLSEYVTDVSRTGAFIRSKDPLPVGTRVNLKFAIVHDEIEIIEGVGEVVRVQADPAGVGVVFSELSPSSRALIERLLAARGAKG